MCKFLSKMPSLEGEGGNLPRVGDEGVAATVAQVGTG